MTAFVMLPENKITLLECLIISAQDNEWMSEFKTGDA
jgi:hypothetical protein